MIQFDSLYDALADTPAKAWLDTLPAHIDRAYTHSEHGDLARWHDAFSQLPALTASAVSITTDTVTAGCREDISNEAFTALETQLHNLHPWRKGPYQLFDLLIDTEWRSDWKWQRVAPHLSPLHNRLVLDIGCGNGYHCWRMLGEGAQRVVGIDPNLLFLHQFNTVKKYVGPSAPIDLLPIGIEALPTKLAAFDTVFSMGVFYHRRSPIDHLYELKNTLRSGGELVLETLVVDGDEDTAFIPTDRYAQMRNVWYLPSALALEKWMQRCGFRQVRTVDINTTSIHEQRSTPWMRFHSLEQFLDSDDHSKTVEGHPAPKRAVVIAEKP